MSQIEIKLLLEFLSEWRSTRDIRERFNLSNTSWYNLKNWLLKGNYIKKISGNFLKNKTNKAILYKKL